MNATTYEIEVGTTEIGSFDGRWRRDAFINRQGEKFANAVMAAGRDDVSRHHSTYEGHRYDSRCSCCYLGIGHTVDLHNERCK